jgi:hypothetical protein
MKRFLIMGAILFASASNAQAIECSADLPTARSGYWSYRIVEGRKCWYEGRRMISKSLLHWSKPSGNDAQVKTSQAMISQAKIANAQAKMPAADRVDFTDPEDGSCCWPPLGKSESFESRWFESFESRWRALLKLDRD